MLIRSLKLLETIAAAGRSLSLSDLASRLAVPKPTVFRLAQRLEQGGYLERELGKGSFTVGPRLLRLGFDALRTGGTNAERRAILTALVTLLGETCMLTALAVSEVVQLDRVETRRPLRVHLEPGARVPLHCTASGKLFLAHMPAARRRRLLESLELTPETPATLTSVEQIEEECAKILQEGYSTDNEEFLRGLITFAVPVADASGAVLAALACHAPSARLPLIDALTHLPELREAARKIAATLPE
jgi:DNA-binding IclR family transcriptional regulator